MAWFLKYYRHSKCRAAWSDEWSCPCNERCPKCDAEIEPYDWDNLSVVVQQTRDRAGWLVLVSPNSAEHKPNYVETVFATREEANDFAEREEARLEAERYEA